MAVCAMTDDKAWPTLLSQPRHFCECWAGFNPVPIIFHRLRGALKLFDHLQQIQHIADRYIGGGKLITAEPLPAVQPGTEKREAFIGFCLGPDGNAFGSAFFRQEHGMRK